jgi:hypothetical protein
MRPTTEFGGIESSVCKIESTRISSSSVFTQVSMTKMKHGGGAGFLFKTYSTVVNCG